jgi:hypothetical protein
VHLAIAGESRLGPAEQSARQVRKDILAMKIHPWHQPMLMVLLFIIKEAIRVFDDWWDDSWRW